MRKMLGLLVMLVAVLYLPACTTRYSGSDLMPSDVAKLDHNAVVYIVTPQDGAYEDKIYEGSGAKTAVIFRDAIAPYAKSVTIGPNAPEEEYMEAALAQKARYVFVPEITNWVHRRAAVSGRASGVTLNVKVLDLSETEEDKTIMHRELRVQGRNMTIKSQHPEAIAKPLVVKYIKEIF